MPSFNSVNYSLRPSKSIQRQLVFGGIRILQEHLDLTDPLYVGLGSIWFTDFVMAHKLLAVRRMISIEANEIGYRRAVYNAPFATVEVRHGISGEVLPDLLSDATLRCGPWLVWLDYDYELNEDVREDIRQIIENAPENTVLLLTFNAHEMRYGAALDRPDRLREILGSVVPDDLPKKACKDERMPATLADLTLDFITAAATDISRPGGFVRAFRLIYQDGAPMVTVGGILPSKGAARVAADVVGQSDWPCEPPLPIRAPNLTIREAGALQAKLPTDQKLSRIDVQGLGFDLEDHEIEAFQAYYQQYPSFAQIVA